MNQNYWLPIEVSEDKFLPITNFFGGNIDYFNEQLKQISLRKSIWKLLLNVVVIV
jgi:hypothetical protein